jgi:methyl-accepting chemotaxis protein
MSGPRFTIGRKVLGVVVGTAALGIVVAAGIAYVKTSSQLNSEARDKLVGLRDSRAQTIKRYLQGIQADIESQAGSPAVREALRAFDDAWRQLDGDASKTLQRVYIDQNPHPKGKKDELMKADDGSRYSAVHADYHPWLKRLQEEKGYYDVFLFDGEGNLVYSVFKERDYATNLRDGEWADSGLGRVFREAANNPAAGTLAFDGFHAYGPSGGAPASFIAKPVLDSNGELLGVIAYQMPVDRMNAVMQQTAGMGETGQSYLVGQDHLMRTDSRFSGADETTILSRRVETPAVKKALAGKRGTAIKEGAQGATVMAAYRPVSFAGSDWALVTEMQESEILAPVAEMRTFLIVAALVLLAVFAAIGAGFSHTLVRPIRALTGAMTRLAEGQHDIDIPAHGRADEIGEMAGAVDVFKQNAIEAERLKREQEDAERRAREEREQAMKELAEGFQHEVGEIIGEVTSAAKQLQGTADTMSRAAQGTSEQVQTVSSSSEQASGNVQTVSSAAQELANSIQEVGDRIHATSQTARAARERMDSARAQVQELAQAADQIGDVIQQIQDIAEKTNLLALNATIEAARAGDAGKGFAVVADEVKSLASQTQKATEDISQRINKVQTETKEAVSAIETVAGSMQEIDDAASSIASAVEEQVASTSEISRNVEEASQGVQNVSESLTQIQDRADQADSGSNEVLTAAQSLSEQADTLNTKVDAFLNKVQAG